MSRRPFVGHLNPRDSRYPSRRRLAAIFAGSIENPNGQHEPVERRRKPLTRPDDEALARGRTRRRIEEIAERKRLQEETEW